MLGVLVLAGLEARGWGFNVAFLLSFGFFSGVLLFYVFLLFWCPSCILHVCLGAPSRFFNAISFLTYKRKEKKPIGFGVEVHTSCDTWISGVC
jgi:hypothetical protein